MAAIVEEPASFRARRARRGPFEACFVNVYISLEAFPIITKVYIR